MPSESEQPGEPATAEPEKVGSRSARAAKVAAAQRARGNSTGPQARQRAPKSLKRL